MKARYGKPAHVIFVILALLVNVCVISTLLVAGVATIKSYTKDATDEFCVMIIAVLFGSYSFIGIHVLLFVFILIHRYMYEYYSYTQL